MATEVKIPIPDQTTEEVRIVKWHKSPGDATSVGEVVLEVETDKSVIEVEATGGGVLLKQLFAEDDMVPVGKVVGLVGEPGEKVETAPAAADQAEPSASSVPAPAAAAAETSQVAAVSGEKVKASPVARKLAAKLGVDLGQVAGSGPQGRITRADVEGFAASGSAATAAVAQSRGPGGRILASPNAKRLGREMGVDIGVVTGSGPGGRVVGADVKQYATSAPAGKGAAAPAAVTGQPEPGSEVVLSKMRRAIGINLQRSAQERPHFNVTMSVEMSGAMAVRSRLNATRDKAKRISVNDLVVRAVALGLKQYPAVNCRLYENSVRYLEDVNIGIATVVSEGLVVPVLQKADERSWDELAAQSKRLAQQARLGKILGAGKGTFTISNLGMFGVDSFTAIINPPEAAILAVGAIKNEVVDIGGGIGIRPMMKLTLCSDHRLVDGALAAEFLRSIKVYLEEEISDEG